MNPWNAADVPGLVLRPWSPAAAPTPAVVACVILRCSDLERLLENAPSWQAGVDRTVVVLGAWTEREKRDTIEDTATAISVAIPNADIVLPPTRGWTDQIEKRSAYFRRLVVGELAFVIDADEELAEGPAALRQAAMGAFDVGWVTIAAPSRYERPYGQPRLFGIPEGGLTYRERHYWVWRGEDLVAAHAYGGTGWLHARVPLTLRNRGGRRKPAHVLQYAKEARAGEGVLDHPPDKAEALRILQLTRYDAGLAVYRLHSAINATTRERSLMVSDQGGDNNTLMGPWQYDLRDRKVVRALAAEADVLHCHVDYIPLTLAGGKQPGQSIVIHHHGTQYRVDPYRWDKLDQQAVLRLGSTMNLLLLDQTHTMEWLPNPIPVELYRRMAVAARAERHDREIWIAHSPSKPRLKGTEELKAAVERLRAKGLKVRLQVTQGMPHAQALWTKAACDLCFDSFWLGIQVSGLEAAAMRMPVVAGDSDTALEYQRRIGAVPYTFADPATLEQVLEELVVDPVHRAAEALKVGGYVLEYHDEAAVARRYLELLRVAASANLRERLRARIQAERAEIAKALHQDVQGVKPIGVHFRLGKKLRPL